MVLLEKVSKRVITKMKLIETNCKYTYKIESDYKIEDKIVFTDKSNLKGNDGMVIGIASFSDHTEYVVSYKPRVRGSKDNHVIMELPYLTNGMFSEEQITSKLEK